MMSPKFFSAVAGAAVLFALQGALQAAPATQARSAKNNSHKPVWPVRSPVPKYSPPNPAYFNLKGYVTAALATDPGLIASRFAEMSNEKEAESVRASYLPYLKGDSELGVLDGSNRFGLFAPTTTQERVHVAGVGEETINVPKQFKTINWDWYSIFGPTLSMPFFKDGSFLGINTPPAVNIKRAEGEALAATARLDAQDVTYRATDLFLQAITTANQAKLMRDRLDWIQKQNDLIHEEAKYNLVSQTDVIVADTQLEETKIEVLIAGQRAVDAFFRIGELLGIEDPHTIRIDTRYPTAKTLPSFESTVLRANLDHPKVAIQQAEAKKAEADVALKRAQLLPTGQVVSAYRVGNNLDDVGQPRWTSFFALSAPIFDFGERYDALKAADLKLQEEQELIEKAHQEVRQAVFEAFTHLREAMTQQSAIVTLVAERQKTVDRLEELNKFQQAPIPELIAAWLALLEAKRAEEAVHYAVLVTSADLEKATGGQWKWMR